MQILSLKIPHLKLRIFVCKSGDFYLAKNSTAGQAGFLPNNDIKWGIALLSSSIINQLIELSQGGGGGAQFEVGIIKRLPWPKVNDDQKKYLENSFLRIFKSKLQLITYEEDSALFSSPFVVKGKISEISEKMIQNLKILKTVTSIENSKIDEMAKELYGLVNENVKCETDYGGEQTNSIQNQDLKKAISIKIMSYLLGSSFGRWDIQYATGENETPELPDPFDSLPICPPGMLQNSSGLPAEPKDVPHDYPLRITWSGIIV